MKTTTKPAPATEAQPTRRRKAAAQGQELSLARRLKQENPDIPSDEMDEMTERMLRENPDCAF